MSYSTIAIIYNPNSTGPSESLARELKAAIKSRLPKQKVELIETKRARHGEELAYSIALASKNPLIISSSGDGGYNEVINGVMKARNENKKLNPTTGLLPAGNANDHFHNLHTKALIDRIVDNDVMNIDLLTVKGISKGATIKRYAHSYIGFGLTPEVGKTLNKTKLNPIKEVWVVAKSLFTIKPIKLVVKRRVKRYESIIFSNVDVMSKYLKISQPSSMTDGKFEVTIFTRRNKLRLILLLLEASIKGVKEDKKTNKFKLKTVDKTSVQADGEIIMLDAKTKVSIGIESKTLACLV